MIAAGVTTQQTMDAIYDAVKNKGGLYLVNINLYLPMLSDGAHLLLPGAHPAARPTSRR